MYKKVGGFMQPIDSSVRELVLHQTGNIVISASAGTGKTYTTIQRILTDRERQTNYQSFAAITFTRKAAKEIMNRLGPNKGTGFVGTNDNFVLTEIIQPFMYDVYGVECKGDIKPDYSNVNQVKTFDEGVEKICNTLFMCKYEDVKKNFSFQLALDILCKSDSARKYLVAKYYRIYIDEYQDSDVDMHRFFMYLSNVLLIPLFIVGDEKQSIYGWRGAYSTGFSGLFANPEFVKFELKHNFRSVQAVQNYANIFIDSVRSYYQKVDFSEEVQICKFTDKNNVARYITEWIDLSKSCAFLNFSNADAESWSKILNANGLGFVYIPSSPLDRSDLESEHIWIARSLANYYHGKAYSEYDFSDEIPMPDAFKLSDIRRHLMKIFENISDYKDFHNNCVDIYNYLGYIDSEETIKKEIKLLFEVVNDSKLEPTYNQDSYKHTSGTIHSSKGLEFKQVIINAQNYDFSRADILFLHYVAVTRPEEKLLILAENNWVYRRYKGYIDNAIALTQALGFDLSINEVIKIVEV